MDLLDRISVESMYKALQKGDLVLTDVNPKGETVSINAITLVNAPPQKVWDTVTDYANLKNIAPLINKSEIKEEKNDKVVVELAAGIKVTLLSISGHITLEMTHYPKDYIIEYKRIAGQVKMMEGGYRILPVDDGKKSIMCCNVAADLKDINRALRYMIEHIPFIIGPLLYAGVGIVGDAVKKKVEKG